MALKLPEAAIDSLKHAVRKLIRRRVEWSIGIYTGDSPLTLKPLATLKNPILTAKDVTDLKAHMIADPFMIRDGGIWYMFFEAMNDFEARGVICLATSTDGLNWKYQKTVLSEPFHLSYPYIFKHNECHYMIPESHQKKSIRLYKSSNFPYQWTFVKELLTGQDFVDSSVLFFDQKWWLFTSLTSNDVLKLYFSDDLMNDWTEHPNSPVIKNNPHTARPGGRVLATGGKIIRYAQDDKPRYGSQVNAFEIKRLSPTEYQEEEFIGNPILKGGSEDWNYLGMHNVDPHQINGELWLACVDGYQVNVKFGIENYKV
jgi:hypothetical protein